MVDSGSEERAQVKGAVIILAVEKVRKLIAQGDVSQAELAGRFDPDELRLFEHTPVLTRFYTCVFYCRCLELLRDIEGDGQDRHLVELGAENAKRMFESNRYQQLDYVQRMDLEGMSDPEERSAAYGRALRLMNSMAAGVYKVVDHAIVPDPDHPLRFAVEITHAEDMGDSMLWVSQGFRNQLAAEHGHADLWYWERPEKDRALLRMNRDP